MIPPLCIHIINLSRIPSPSLTMKSTGLATPDLLQLADTSTTLMCLNLSSSVFTSVKFSLITFTLAANHACYITTLLYVIKPPFASGWMMGLQSAVIHKKTVFLRLHPMSSILSMTSLKCLSCLMPKPKMTVSEPLVRLARWPVVRPEPMFTCITSSPRLIRLRTDCGPRQLDLSWSTGNRYLLIFDTSWNS